MANGRINENILNELHKKCSNDKTLDLFLNELIYKEIESHGGLWKDVYKSLIENYVDNGGKNSEN